MRVRQATIEDSAVIAQLMAQLMEVSGYEDRPVSPERIEESLRKMADEAVFFELEFGEDGI